MAKTCPVCNGPVSVMRRSDFCSKDCAAGVGRVLVHSCLGNIADAPPSKCNCKYRVSILAARKMVDHGEAVAFESRIDAFDGGPILLRVAQKTPRVATIEAGHIRRVATFKEDRRRPNLSKKQIEELQRAVAEEKAMRESEYRVRWDEYHRLDMEMLNALIAPFQPDPWEGRAIFANASDDRTTISKDLSPKRDDAFVPDVFAIEDQIEGEVIEQDPQTVSLDQAEAAEEFEYAAAD